MTCDLRPAPARRRARVWCKKTAGGENTSRPRCAIPQAALSTVQDAIELIVPMIIVGSL